MHDGDGIRQDRPRLVMVGDDQIHAELAGHVGGLERRDAAIDGDENARARLGQGAHRLAVEAVAFLDPMGDIEIDLGAEQGQQLPEDGDAGDAVDVVVAVDGDLLFLLDGLAQAGDGRLDPRHMGRPDQLGQLRLQEHVALGGLRDPAIEQHLRHQRRDPQRPGQRLHPLIDGGNHPEILLRPCRCGHLFVASHAYVRKSIVKPLL